MLTLPPGARLLLATSRVEGRKGINRLSTLVRSQFLTDPLSGMLFVFFTKRADIVRVLYWDRDGYVLTTKRFEKGYFRVPWRSETGHVALEAVGIYFPLARLSRRKGRPGAP
jgi:transposase